jgi:type IV fimbrial biogenesis protein FimT
MNAKGFTLVELTATIAITGVLLALAAPSFIDFIESNRLTTKTNEIVGVLNYARSESVKRNDPVIVGVNVSNQHTMIVKPLSCQNESCWLRVIDKMPEDYTIKFYEGTDIIYQGNGSVEQAGYLKLCTPNNIKVIIVQPIGQLQIAKDRDENGLPELFNPESGNFEDVSPCAK